MKTIFKLLVLVAIVSCTACSDIDTENPIVNMPSSGSTSNGSDDSSQKVSIVGTWQQTVKFTGEYSETIILKYVFNQNGTGTFYRTYYSSPDESDIMNFTYTFDMALGELCVKTIYATLYMSAFIVVDNNREALHLSAFNDLDDLSDGVFRRVQ